MVLILFLKNAVTFSWKQIPTSLPLYTHSFRYIPNVLKCNTITNSIKGNPIIVYLILLVETDTLKHYNFVTPLKALKAAIIHNFLYIQ